jgi:hypothetical protein
VLRNPDSSWQVTRIENQAMAKSGRFTKTVRRNFFASGFDLDATVTPPRRIGMKHWILCLLVFASSLSATAQTTNTVHNHTTNEDIIDGSKTPELVPDSTAWRLWLLAVTATDPQHPELDQARQDAQLLSAGFEREDLPVMRQNLSTFKIAYDALVEDHNQAVTRGSSPSVVSFKAARDSLVKATQTRMLSIKVDAEARVRGFINQQKRHMRVSKTEVQ